MAKSDDVDARSNRDAEAPPHEPSVVGFAFGDFRLDLRTRQLLRGDEAIALTPKAFDMLAILIRNRARVMSKDDLLAAVWPKSYVTEDSLTQNVWALRRALHDDSNQPLFISTIPRTGYRFIADVAEIRETSSELTHGAAEAPAVDSRVVADAALSHQLHRSHGWSHRATWLVILAVIGGTAVVAWFVRSTAAVAASTAVAPVSFTQEPPEGTALLPDLAVSPDGRVLAFVAQATTTRESHLWVRELVSGEVRRLDGTSGATQPFWSPDSSAMGFFAKGQLKIVELRGRAPRTIATVGVLPQGGSWGANDVILFAPWMSGLYAVPVAAGPPRAVTTLDREFDERAHRRPQFLDDGVHFLFDVTSTKRGGTFVGSMEEPGRTQLFDSPASHVLYVRPDRLFSFRDGTLTTARLEAQRRVVGSAPARLLTPLVPPAFGARSGFSVSQAGVLAFGGGRTVEQFISLTRDGRKTGLMKDVPTLNPAISPDERYLAATGRDSMAGIWLVDIERGASTRVVEDGSYPAWSPAGDMLAYSAPRAGGIADIYVRTIAMTGAAEERLLLRTSESKVVNDWSRDGKYIVFVSRNPQMKHDLWLLPMTGDRKPIPYLQTSFSQQQAQVSPDGRWLAYSSDESGTWEVYLQSFPVPGGKRTVSVGGGGEPKWRADGRELFYVRPDHTLMAVEIPDGDPTKAVGTPVPLFSVPLNGETSNYRSRYIVLGNGTRFLFYALDDTTEAPITVLVNWPALVSN